MGKFPTSRQGVFLWVKGFLRGFVTASPTLSLPPRFAASSSVRCFYSVRKSGLFVCPPGGSTLKSSPLPIGHYDGSASSASSLSGRRLRCRRSLALSAQEPAFGLAVFDRLQDRFEVCGHAVNLRAFRSPATPAGDGYSQGFPLPDRSLCPVGFNASLLSGSPGMPLGSFQPPPVLPCAVPVASLRPPLFR